MSQGVRGYPRHRKHTGNEEISPRACPSISWIVLNPILREVLAGTRSGARELVRELVFTAMKENPDQIYATNHVKVEKPLIL